jgi:hypothetical protein
MPGDRAQILLRVSSCRLAFERTEVSARETMAGFGIVAQKGNVVI